MAWQDKYVEIVEKINKLKNIDSVNIDSVQDSLSDIVVQVNNHKLSLVEQLTNQGVEATEENSLTELIQMIEEIEGGGEIPDYDFLSNIKEVNSLPMKVEVSGVEYELKSYEGSGMKGDFPIYRNLKIIDISAFHHSEFTGKFPLLFNIEEIQFNAFLNSNFTGEFPLLPNIVSIDINAFNRSEFTGEFPLLPKIVNINHYAFSRSEFTGEFPYMETLTSIGSNAFNQSDFDKDEDGFVKNYPGWDGKSNWEKPASYRASMADQIPPKLMTIITPGAGSLEVYDDIQGERVKKYLEENEPSDIDYYLEYTQKLRDIGFERDEFGNYVDMVNDKSVIIIPEDIKFLV